ncbi:MAG: NUDIX hydrolase [Saprospiraceae bacterium]
MEKVKSFEASERFHPGLSLDCVIFGFHDNQMQVLLLKMKHTAGWALPGGFVFKEESLEAAAYRVLKDRTGLENIFLNQFHVFGDPMRADDNYNEKLLEKADMGKSIKAFFKQRFVTVGYYALVNFSNTIPRPDDISEECRWWNLHEVPPLIIDHPQILNKALETLRLQLRHQPIGYNLLPEKFTMPELQKLYETILGKTLDRRNFQRKVLSYGILKKLDETRKGGAHKAPYLYSFDLEKYQKALEQGLQGEW